MVNFAPLIKSIENTKVLYLNVNSVKYAVEKAFEFERITDTMIFDLQAECAQKLRLLNEASEALASANEALSKAKADKLYAETKLKSTEDKLAKAEDRFIQATKKARKKRIPLPSTTDESGNIVKKEVKNVDDGVATQLDVIYDKDGNKIGYSVKLPTGEERSGNFSAASGARISTITKNKHGETTFIYDSNGEVKDIIKGKAESPKVIKTTKYTDTKTGKETLVEEMSDGSVITRIKDGDIITVKTTINDVTTEIAGEENLYSGLGKMNVCNKYDSEQRLKSVKIKTQYDGQKPEIITAEVAQDIDGINYVRKGKLEYDGIRINGELSKRDRIGNLEEFKFDATFDDYAPILEGHRRTKIDGTCDIIKEGDKYTLKHETMTINAGNQTYTVKFYEGTPAVIDKDGNIIESGYLLYLNKLFNSVRNRFVL